MGTLKLKLSAVAKYIKVPVRVLASVHHKVRMKLLRLRMGSYAKWVRKNEDKFIKEED